MTEDKLLNYQMKLIFPIRIVGCKDIWLLDKEDYKINVRDGHEQALSVVVEERGMATKLLIIIVHAGPYPKCRKLLWDRLWVREACESCLWLCGGHFIAIKCAEEKIRGPLPPHRSTVDFSYFIV